MACLLLQDALSQLPLERSGEGTESVAEPGTALSSPRPAGTAAAGSVDADLAAPSMYAESEAAGSTGSRPNKGSKGAGAGISNNRQREEEYFGVCHTDVVKCIVITDTGKIFTAG